VSPPTSWRGEDRSNSQVNLFMAKSISRVFRQK